MKRGFSLDIRFVRHNNVFSQNRGPDEEGIFTGKSNSHPVCVPFRQNRGPDEEGIFTQLPGNPASRELTRQNRGPDEEGIFT